jgi:HSP20 family protein
MGIPEKLFISRGKKVSPEHGVDSIDAMLEDRIQESSQDESLVDSIEKKLPLDLIETDRTYIILSPVPGIPIKNITLTLDSDTLTIAGKTHKANFVKGETVYKECSWGSFSRSITLPKNIKRTGHKANIKDGILTVILPKIKKKDPKTIPISSYDE